ncbi:MAG: ABC transporter ATP-binding protein [Planctomycetes bacterium]|nr:ABC transporter ATP-binding protein [Planctomycetota bacterium]
MQTQRKHEKGRTVIELRGVVKVLGEGETAFEALKGIDLRITQGEFCAVVGPSGSGKSTLMYLLGALDRPTRGEILIEGANIAGLDDRGLAQVRNSKLGFIFQFHYLMPELTALENVMMPMFRAGTGLHEASQRADELLSELGLGEKAHRPPGRLSGGEQQRVAIARALANQPLVVLGDEPTGNLDTQNADKVFAIFERLVKEQNQTIVVVTHDLDMAARTQRIIRIVDGRIMDDGPTQEVLERHKAQAMARND